MMLESRYYVMRFAIISRYSIDTQGDFILFMGSPFHLTCLCTAVLLLLVLLNDLLYNPSITRSLNNKS